MNITKERVEAVRLFHLDNFTAPEVHLLTGIPQNCIYRMTSDPRFLSAIARRRRSRFKTRRKMESQIASIQRALHEARQS